MEQEEEEEEEGKREGRKRRRQKESEKNAEDLAIIFAVGLSHRHHLVEWLLLLLMLR